jgi:translation initiation factor IF-2
MQEELLVEDFGGDVQCALVSAKENMGIDELLEKILLQAEVMQLKASLDAPLEATVIEGKIDKGYGVVITGLVNEGILKVGQMLVAGSAYGKVRLLLNDQGKSVQSAGPSSPIRVSNIIFLYAILSYITDQCSYIIDYWIESSTKCW